MMEEEQEAEGRSGRPSSLVVIVLVVIVFLTWK